MREIKFRGKTLKGEWVNGYYWTNEVGNHFIKVVTKDNGYFCNPHDYEVDGKTVGQYTNLKDKNGVEIYEGNIVKMHQFLFDGSEYENEVIGAIKEGGYGWLLSKINSKKINSYMGYENGEGETDLNDFYGLHEDSFEVIGNIHDNPELLERTNDND